MTTLKTMESVIQDWLSECETTEELNAMYSALTSFLHEQLWAMYLEKTELKGTDDGK